MASRGAAEESSCCTVEEYQAVQWLSGALSHISSSAWPWDMLKASDRHREEGMFSPAAAVYLYCSLVLTRGVDDCYWSAAPIALSLSLSSCHIYTRLHTWHWQQQQSIAKLGQFVDGFRKKPRDAQTQRLMTLKKKKNTHNASLAAAGIT